MDVINVGLGAVLYNTETHTYYTPNTDTQSNPMDEESPIEGEENQNPQETGGVDEQTMIDMLTDHVLTQEFDASGNSSE